MSRRDGWAHCACCRSGGWSRWGCWGIGCVCAAFCRLEVCDVQHRMLPVALMWACYTLPYMDHAMCCVAMQARLQAAEGGAGGNKQKEGGAQQLGTGRA